MTDSITEERSGTGFTQADLEVHRRELTGYCYRMLGSAFDAEDAVQEAFVRAWRSADRFEGRSSLRTWLFRIATNICLDALRAGRRRARPMDLGPASTVRTAELRAMPEHTWVEPVPDAAVLPDGDPAEVAAARESIRLAFVAALQYLPPRQRAVLLLRDVLAWRATEVAGLLGTSVPAVNSALQRARATLAVPTDTAVSVGALGPEERALLDRYVTLFEEYDIEAFVELLHEDARQSMPPYDLWLVGRGEIAAWLTGPGAECRGSRLVATAASGLPAFGQYRLDPDGVHRPWALQVLEISDGRIAGFHAFLDTARLFPLFGLPSTLPPPAAPVDAAGVTGRRGGRPGSV